MLKCLTVTALFLAIVAHAQVVGNRKPQHNSASDEAAHPPTCVGCIQIRSGTAEKKEEPEHKPYQWSEFVAPTNIISLVLAGAAIFAGWMALKSVFAIREQTRETARSAKATEDAALATKSSADATLKQFTIALSAERPWLVMNIKKGRDGNLDFWIINVGRSVAKIVSLTWEYTTYGVYHNQIPKCPTYDPLAYAMDVQQLLPSKDKFMIDSFDYRQWRKEHSGVEVASIDMLDTRLFAVGKISYIDFSEQAAGIDSLHETWWCRVYDEDSGGESYFTKFQTPQGWNGYT